MICKEPSQELTGDGMFVPDQREVISCVFLPFIEGLEHLGRIFARRGFAKIMVAKVLTTWHLVRPCF